MKFLVDAQLPRRLAEKLSLAGHNVIHTLNLPLGNRTPDADIARLAVNEQRIVVSKNSDFVTMFLLHGIPPKLLLISTGNISNDELCGLFARNLAFLEKTFAENVFVELDNSTIRVHC